MVEPALKDKDKQKQSEKDREKSRTKTFQMKLIETPNSFTFIRFTDAVEKRVTDANTIFLTIDK